MTETLTNLDPLNFFVLFFSFTFFKMKPTYYVDNVLLYNFRILIDNCEKQDKTIGIMWGDLPLNEARYIFILILLTQH